MIRHASVTRFDQPICRQQLNISRLVFTVSLSIFATAGYALPDDPQIVSGEVILSQPNSTIAAPISSPNQIINWQNFSIPPEEVANFIPNSGIAVLDAQSMPTGGQIISGEGSISQTDTTTTIQQASDNLSINWQSFDIPQQHTVNFVQPSPSSIAVNHILDNNGTQIFGHLNANGQVYLISPSGIYFGRDAQVNVGGLVASTLNFDDASLGQNSKTFSGNGTGSIVNQGTITTTEGGYVALLSNNISNEGVISAQLGNVAFGTGNAVTLTFNGNSLVDMQVDQSTLDSLSEKNQLVHTGDDQVLMTEDAKNQVLAGVVNYGGVVEAVGVEIKGGAIVLTGMQETNLAPGGSLELSSGGISLKGAESVGINLSLTDMPLGGYAITTGSIHNTSSSYTLSAGSVDGITSTKLDIPAASEWTKLEELISISSGTFANTNISLIPTNFIIPQFSGNLEIHKVDQVISDASQSGQINKNITETALAAQNAATQLMSNLTAPQSPTIDTATVVTEPALTIMQDGMKLPGIN